jgi:hypothetical protein
MALCLLLTGARARSQQISAGEINYSRFTLFRIPFQADVGGRIKQLQLYVSQDQGKSWHPVVTVTPEQRHFDFRAPQDGLYWFAVRTVDQDNRAFPLSMEGVQPGLRVVVDTRPPVIHLTALPPRDGDVGVTWEVRDENLDPASLRLDYHLVGSPDWIPLAADLSATGQRYWRPATNGPVEVRLRARDRADNWSEEKATLTPGVFTGRSTAVNPDPGAPRPSESAIRLVNSKHFGINYEIKDKGPSGVSAVELWYTQDPAARIWNKYRSEEGNPPQPPFKVDVQGEGLYGFTLVVRSGVGLGEREPQVGDQPQVWVEVDLTKPVVKLGAIDVGRGPETGRLTIQWTASDKNFGAQPITLSYAEQTAGPWKAVATNLENTGRYVWQMPSDVPYKFLVRVEATDRAGNVGTDVTARPIIVDLSQPKSVILNVEPVKTETPLDNSGRRPLP